MRKDYRRNTLILTIITVVAGLGLGLVYQKLQKSPLQEPKNRQKRSVAGSVQ